jgi:hypothetical protein
VPGSSAPFAVAVDPFGDLFIADRPAVVALE